MVQPCFGDYSSGGSESFSRFLLGGAQDAHYCACPELDRRPWRVGSTPKVTKAGPIPRGCVPRRQAWRANTETHPRREKRKVARMLHQSKRSPATNDNYVAEKNSSHGLCSHNAIILVLALQTLAASLFCLWYIGLKSGPAARECREQCVSRAGCESPHSFAGSTTLILVSSQCPTAPFLLA